MESPIPEADAIKSVDLVKDYLSTAYGTIAHLSFRIHNIKPNDKASIYYVIFSYILDMKEKKRIYQKATVDISNTTIEIKDISENELNQ